MDQPSDNELKVICAILLSDSAIREMGTGKVTIVGLFNGWNCPFFPFPTPPFCITICVSNLNAGTKEVNIVVRIEQKSSGLVLGNVGAQIRFPEGTPIGRNTVIDIPFLVPGIQIPQPGEYRVVVLSSDEKLDERPVQVTLAKPPPNSPPFQFPHS
jgi:hypothetical protein